MRVLVLGYHRCPLLMEHVGYGRLILLVLMTVLGVSWLTRVIILVRLILRGTSASLVDVSKSFWMVPCLYVNLKSLDPLKSLGYI